MTGNPHTTTITTKIIIKSNKKYQEKQTKIKQNLKN